MEENIDTTEIQAEMRSISAASRKAFWRRIYAPLLAGCILLAAGGWAIMSGDASSLRGWADVSAILLLAPLLIAALAVLLLLFGLAFGVSRLIAWIPTAAQAVSRVLASVSKTLRNVSDLLVKPFMIAAGLRASFRSAIAGGRKLFKRQ